MFFLFVIIVQGRSEKHCVLAFIRCKVIRIIIEKNKILNLVKNIKIRQKFIRNFYKMQTKNKEMFRVQKEGTLLQKGRSFYIVRILNAKPEMEIMTKISLLQKGCL